MPSNDGNPSTSLNLLAPDGIMHVAFASVLTSEQYAELLAISQRAETARDLERGLLKLGEAWGIVTVTELVSRKMPPHFSASSPENLRGPWLHRAHANHCEPADTQRCAVDLAFPPSLPADQCARPLEIAEAAENADDLRTTS